MNLLVLSVFPGIDLLGRAFEEEGFCVIRGPDVLWGGDVRRFHPPARVFGGVIGGPPCQPFSRLAAIVRHNRYGFRHGNLIPEFARVVEEAQPDWWLMENVPQAPSPDCPRYQIHEFVYNNRWLGEEQSRRRKFWFGTYDGRRLPLEEAAFESPLFEPVVAASDWRRTPIRIGGSGKPKATRLNSRPPRSWQEILRLQGLPDDFDLPGFLKAAKVEAVGNGVPIPLGRMLARGVFKAMAKSDVRYPHVECPWMVFAAGKSDGRHHAR